ncbi:hypothetical protein MAR_012074 [Mya arenaria]|uniref:Uncharacterized protein n=1 Tax=Mya arenaria TaxID=6604 RepID=A0ABY7FWJ8_MYAAR|nr:hypothetical protein MAR_012074 [Mya arenaria]
MLAVPAARLFIREKNATISRGMREGQIHVSDILSLDSNCMLDKSRCALRHFTPCPTPYSAGVNIISSGNCYVFPPFVFLFATLRFLTKSTLTCLLILPLSDVTPYWFQKMIQFVKDAFHLGKKVSESLWVIRVAPDKDGQVIGPLWGKLTLTKLTATSKNNHFVCVGDSIIRFLLSESRLHNPLAHIFFISGRLISETINHLFRLENNIFQRVLLVHTGVYNLS